MDISYEIDSNKQCFKLPQEAFGNFNIKYYESSAYTVFWNKYQIFVYEDLSFESPKIVIPEFNIENLILSNNYLICLDDNGTIHLTPLKFKNSVQKKFKSSFLPRGQGIKCIQLFNEHTILCIKSVANTLYVCTHKINTDFQIDMQVKLLFDHSYAEQLQLKPWIFHVYLTSQPEYDQIKSLYKLDEIWKEHAIVLISLDRKSIYSVLYSNKTVNEVLQPIKLYSCPSEIINMGILKSNGLSVLLTLNIGTVIKIPLNKATNDIKIVHLNTGIYRVHATEHIIIYTDGNTMWKSERTFSDPIKLKKCFVKHVQDFTVIGDKLLCTTFSHLIYLFLIEDKSVFEDVSEDAYCPAHEVLNNSDCLSMIVNEVEKSNEIVKKIKMEETYITTLSLSNRHDIMDSVIDYHALVFETFDDIPKEDLTLIENIKEYYDMDTLNFLISVSTKPLVDKFNELLSNMFGNLKIHLDFSSGTQSIKTVVVNVVGQLKKINIVVPLSMKNLNKIIIDIKLITSITEVFDTSQNVWTVLHRKKLHLNSENFINTYAPTNQIHCTENNVPCINETIYKCTVDHFGHLYNFYRRKSDKLTWTFYVKLATNYEKLLKNETYLNKCFNKRKAEILLKQITSTDFLNSKNELIFDIVCDKVYVEIINDGFTKPILRVSCNNLEKAYYIRNFLSQLMHNNFIGFETEKEFVDHALYSTIEKLNNTIREAINRLPFSRLELMKLFEKYQKNVIGKLPI